MSRRQAGGLTISCIVAFVAVMGGILYQIVSLGWGMTVVITLVAVLGAAVLGYRWSDFWDK